jgi:type IV secretory pathway VirJ component
MMTRLPADLRERVALLALIGPIQRASLQFHWVDLARTTHRASDLSVGAEVERLRGARILCIYGRDDKEALCPALDPTLAHLVERPAGHRVAPEEAGGIVETILGELKR